MPCFYITGMGNSMPKPLTPLECILKHCKMFNPSLLKKSQLVILCMSAWPTYTSSQSAIQIEVLIMILFYKLETYRK